MKKLKVLTLEEEKQRVKDSLENGTCFITKESLDKQPYKLVLHEGTNTYVYVKEKL